ncbi:hypothetical protein K9L67_01885 [Candidatus Woesearchaeota archaeon]|nr:hypothetical protein [Candidatus Woesearchaeota archaeon]MCF7900954.1 hypothetical protein [Candidatus Woesearchaeota archaeon]MCF8013600.1 hypothetical protein [Candidatus Woesearchaeota archaeon]
MKKILMILLIIVTIVITACGMSRGGCNNDGFCSLEEQIGECKDCWPDFEVE